MAGRNPGVASAAPDPSDPAVPRGPVAVAWIIVLVLAAMFLAVRLRYPAVFEYEAAESSVASAAFIEHGTPPRAYHRIRYTAIYAGPLHAYLKTIPYFVTLDPGGEIVFINLLNVCAAIMFFFLLRRLFGLLPATLTLFLLVFSVPSIERCTAIHVRCYSVPLVLIAMVLVARVLLLREYRLMPLLAVAFAFATQVYGFATFFLPPGLLLLFLLYRPRIAPEVWRKCAAIFAVLQIPWIIDDVWRGIDGPVSVLRNGLFTFPAQDAQDIDQARAGALGYIGSITRVVIFDKDTMFVVGILALCVMAAYGVGLLVRRRQLRGNPDLFFLIWLVMFLVLPAYLGAGGRVYLAQFLGPLIVARGLTIPFAWLRTRGWRPTRLAAQVLGAAVAGIAIVAAFEHLAGPRPTTILSDPTYPQSLQELRGVVQHVHDRGLGRTGFNQRVHGAALQRDAFADTYLFWTVCHDDTRVPCSAVAAGLSPQTHFAVLDQEFPYRPAEGTVTQLGALRLVEYESRLRLPLRAIAFASPQEGAEPSREDARVAGPPHALIAPPPGVSPSDEADRLALLDPWPSDRPGVPTFPIRRASQVAALMVEHGLDGPAFADEARYPGPEGPPLEVVLRGTLEIDQLPEAGKELHLFLTASADAGRCQASILLDGVRLPQSRPEDSGGDWGMPLLKLQADTTGFLRPGRHAVTVRLHECSAELYDFYDLVVWKK